MLFWKSNIRSIKPNLVCRGFTLVELLAAIAVVAVVITFAIPALRSVKNSTRVAISMSGHKQVYSLVSIYTTSNRGVHPFVYWNIDGTYTEPIFHISNTPGLGYTPAPMYSQSRVWPSVLFDDTGLIEIVYPARWHELRNQDSALGIVAGSYVATSTLFALPVYFSPDLSRVHSSQIRATQSHQIKYPASKVLFEDMDTWGIVSDSTLVRAATFGFGDGSADALKVTDFVGTWEQRAVAWRVGPGHTTTDGLAGRDR